MEKNGTMRVMSKRMPEGPWPLCQNCRGAVMLPLSDYGQDGASVIYKAWACSNPACGFCLRIDRGQVSHGRRREDRPEGNRYRALARAPQ
jgi:hypothetical protein